MIKRIALVLLLCLFCPLTGSVIFGDVVISYDAGLAGNPITAPDPQTDK